MINYGSDEDVAQLIAHKIGAYPDITPHNVKGMIMRVLSMMGHRPQDLDYVVDRVKAILTGDGKMNENTVNELSLAQMDDETIHTDSNEDAALYLRSQMQKYQPINMARAIKLVHRKYDGEKSQEDIHDILSRFVKYLKLDGKFITSSVVETKNGDALAAKAEDKKHQTEIERQRRHEEEMDKEKKIHQAASRNIRGDSVTVEEASKHRKIMNDHFKRARALLYGFPTATQDDCDHDADESNTTTIMSAGETAMGEAEEIESTDGADGTISQDGDELTEASGDEQTANIVVDLDGMPTNVDVTFIHSPEADDPIHVISMVRSDNGDPVDMASLSAVEQYQVHSGCFQATQEEVDECDVPMIESDQTGKFHFNTTVSTSEEDDIPVIINYDVDQDDAGVYAVIQTVIRKDDGQDIKSQINPADMESIEDDCYRDYQEYAKDHNDDMKISRHLGNMGEDMRPTDTPGAITDERAARKVAREIMGMPNLTLAVVEKWTSKLVGKMGKSQDDVEKIAKMAFDELAKVGLAIKEADETVTSKVLDETKDKMQKASLELPIDEHGTIGDVDVTVSYKVNDDSPEGLNIDIFKVVRDDTQEDVTTKITPHQQEVLMYVCSHAATQMEDDDHLGDIEYLDKREKDYMDAASKNALTKGTYKTFGKVFQTYVFDNDDDANAFMSEHSGWGVIGVEDDGKVHVAKKGDVGVEESASADGVLSMTDTDFKPYFADAAHYQEFCDTDGDTDPELMCDLANEVLKKYKVPLTVVDVDFDESDGTFIWKVIDEGINESMLSEWHGPSTLDTVIYRDGPKDEWDESEEQEIPVTVTYTFYQGSPVHSASIDDTRSYVEIDKVIQDDTKENILNKLSRDEYDRIYHECMADADSDLDENCDGTEGPVVRVPRDQQKSLEDEIEVGGRNGPEQQAAYIKRMKALAGLK